MAFFGASALINSLGGGAVGGALGYANTGSWQGAAGGAAAGAAFGGLGGGRLGNWAGGYTSKGGIGALNASIKYGQKVQSWAQKNVGAVGKIRSNSANFLTKNMGPQVGRMARGRDWLGNAKNAECVNQWGSRAATAAGLGAASYIGSSMIGSNSGY